MNIAYSSVMRRGLRFTGCEIDSLMSLPIAPGKRIQIDMNDTVILYVEDNVDNRLLVRRILMSEDYQVLEAGNAQQALKVLEKHKPDLILMDINMPETDGYTLTAQIKSRAGMQAVPIIALTANVMKGDRERSLSAGCDGYIQKPIDVDKLAEQLRQYLDV